MLERLLEQRVGFGQRQLRFCFHPVRVRHVRIYVRICRNRLVVGCIPAFVRGIRACLAGLVGRIRERQHA